ncbi:MAG TPA: hypothetical protein VFK06_15090 [Candidatus Angelobacter sp.]|nr:hypothetical protein [Candidatus Angelobacter sp.]
MTRPVKPECKEFYSEAEAAKALNISISYLYVLLDENVFNEGTLRPPDMTFCDWELVLLRFWSSNRKQEKIVRMPRRFEAFTK